MLAAIAAKGVKELTYHRDYAAQWVIRLGDGTDVSHARMQAALDALWPLVEELFLPAPGEPRRCPASRPTRPLPGPRPTPCSTPCSPRPTLDRPDAAPLAPVGGRTGRDGVHTEALGYVLAEMQSVARAHPDATW